jgi:dihydrofolate reductase
MTIRLIYARDVDYGIGKNNGLPWHLPEDLKYFKEQTTGDIVVMGSNTWRSLNGKPLANRLNVICSIKDYQRIKEQTAHLDNVLVINNVYWYLIENVNKQIWIIGGSQFFNDLWWIADEIHETLIFKDFGCDVKIKKFNKNFKPVSQTAIRYSESANLEYRITVSRKDEDFEIFNFS